MIVVAGVAGGIQSIPLKYVVIAGCIPFLLVISHFWWGYVREGYFLDIDSVAYRRSVLSKAALEDASMLFVACIPLAAIGYGIWYMFWR